LAGTPTKSSFGFIYHDYSSSTLELAGGHEEQGISLITIQENIMAGSNQEGGNKGGNQSSQSESRNSNQSSGGGGKGSGSGNSGGNNQSDTSNRGFASMDPDQQRELAAEGGRAAHASGNAHEFTSEEARKAGSMSHKNDGNQQSDSGGRDGNRSDSDGGGRNSGGSGGSRGSSGSSASSSGSGSGGKSK
jgi:hypothetical protein